MRAAVPTVIALVAAYFACRLHLNGHTLGDDFALYLRQAKSIFEGNPSQVVDDNRFSVINSPPGFSPIIYPWGWPLLLSPFVQWWGLDLDRLKLIEVALLCVIVVWLHGLVRRRTNRWVAAAVMVAIALSPVYLRHTDQLLTEFPHLAAVLATLWWIDRLRRRATDPSKPWLTAPRTDLIIVGLLGVAAYNMRREGIIFFGVFAAGQAVDVIRVAWARRGPRLDDDVPMTAHLRQIAVPHASMFVGIVLFQLLIPSMLVPDNGGGLRYVPQRIGDSFAVIAHQLGLGKNDAWGVALVLTALVGMALACWRDATRNVPVVALVLLSTVTVSTHFRLVDRYYLQVTPFVVFFAAYAVYAVVTLVVQPIVDNERRRRGVATAFVCVPLFLLVPLDYAELLDDFAEVDTFNDAGRVQWGPGHADFQPVFTAVEAYTPPDAVIGFFRARTMTLYTDRRTVQSAGSLDTMEGIADYFAMQKYSNYSQPLLTDEQAAEAGLEKVWEDKTWVLWKFPSAGGDEE